MSNLICIISLITLIFLLDYNACAQRVYFSAGPQCSFQTSALIKSQLQYGAKGAFGIRFQKHRLEMVWGFCKMGGMEDVFTSGSRKSWYMLSTIPLHPKQQWSLRLLAGGNSYRINQKDIDNGFIKFQDQHIAWKCMVLGTGVSCSIKENILASLDYNYENPITTNYSKAVTSYVSLGLVYVLTQKEYVPSAD
jgi:hypothetical protein